MRDRRRAWLSGKRAEMLAAWLLRLKGYRILARGLRLPVGEIDILARRGRILAVVEVKQRPSLDDGLQAVSRRQRRRLARAAESYLAQRRELNHLHLRFDLIVSMPGGRFRHIIDAWRPDSSA
jgi:putative endonuclease